MNAENSHRHNLLPTTDYRQSRGKQCLDRVGCQKPLKAKRGSSLNLDQLIKLGKINVGEELVWQRRGIGVQHRAKVIAGGKIQTADGAVHKTPSGAAKHLNGSKPVDGWLAWKLSSGKPLGSLR